ATCCSTSATASGSRERRCGSSSARANERRRSERDVTPAAWGSAIACLAIGYVSGSLPWGLWLGRWFRGVDVRTVGSMNLGATNVFRSLGRGLGLATLALDILKGALPVWIVPALPIAASFPGGREACALAVGLAAVAGHVWTFLAGFRGGKGVATTVGVLLAV